GVDPTSFGHAHGTASDRDRRAADPGPLPVPNPAPVNGASLCAMSGIHHHSNEQEVPMKICVAGQGAFGQKHLDALKRIPGVEVTSLIGGNQVNTEAIAKKYGVPHFSGDLAEEIG